MVVMPRMGGGELLRAFCQLHPDARILVCSAYVRDPALRELLQAGHHAVLPKPFSPTDLLVAVADSLAQPSAREQQAEPQVSAARCAASSLHVYSVGRP
jgi:DNA-binding NarL/FixJ family response regulator